MGNFDTTKTDDTLRNLFVPKDPETAPNNSKISEEKILEYLRGKTMQDVLELLAKSQR